MKRVNCPELCPDCPLAAQIPAPRAIEKSGRWQNAIGEVVRSSSGTKISFDFENGQPVGHHLIEVGLINKQSETGLGFWVKDSTGLEGVEEALARCDHPVSVRSGFLKLGKTVMCGAVSEFAEEV